MPVLRRFKIAAASLLLAVFAVGMVGGMVLPLIGVPLTPTPTVTVTPSGVVEHDWRRCPDASGRPADNRYGARRSTAGDTCAGCRRH